MMLFSKMWVFCLLFVGSLLTSRAIDYCSIACDGLPHTMCQYSVGGGEWCEGQEGGLSAAERELLLTLHNQRRQGVARGWEPRGQQPPAADMAELAWDEELAAVAQRWADQCTLGPHDGCRSRADGSWVGQNVLEGWIEPAYLVSRETVIKEAVSGWYEEVAWVTPQILERFHPGSPDKPIGHYTQMVWAETCRVGCGMSLLKGGQRASYRVVCNYWPGGNTRTLPIYRQGEPCSGCPANSGCSPQYPGLCRGL